MWICWLLHTFNAAADTDTTTKESESGKFFCGQTQVRFVMFLPIPNYDDVLSSVHSQN